MSKIIVKKDKPKVNDGGHSPFGVDLDPDKNLCHVTQEDGDQKTYYKGSKMKYDDYLSELETRVVKNSKGKDFTSSSIGTFAGWGKGTLKNLT